MTIDSYSTSAVGLSNPAIRAEAVTPSDSEGLNRVSRALYVGTGGDVAVVMRQGGEVTFAGVPDGSLLPIRARQVMATGTTASNIVALD